MLDWFGPEGDRLTAAFKTTFGAAPRPFGTRSMPVGGVSDGAEGVQWNAKYDPRDRRQWASVNLEGMKYSGWPVARLIQRELRHPTLPALAARAGDPEGIEVRWRRDYWQASARPRILEADIGPTPIALRELTEAAWRQALEGARDCLEWQPNIRRARQRVTLAAAYTAVEGDVSPHLTITLVAERYRPWDEFLDETRRRLRPFYDWARERVR
jgi:hypothetical protein